MTTIQSAIEMQAKRALAQDSSGVKARKDKSTLSSWEQFTGSPWFDSHAEEDYVQFTDDASRSF